MKKNNIANYLQIAANLAILGGLILVGVQIREANKVATADSILGAWNGVLVSNELIVGEDLAASWARAQTNSRELTDEDLVKINAFLRREWQLDARNRLLRDLGYETSDQEKDHFRWVGDYLGNETSLRWWRGLQNGSMVQLNPDLRDRINAELEIRGESHGNYHKSWLKVLSGQEEVSDSLPASRPRSLP